MSVGTTSPIPIPRDAYPKSIKPGAGYFWVQIHSAQAAFRGAVWKQAKGLVVTSQVNLNHPSLGGSVRAIQRSRQVRKNGATQLGLNPNLIELVPATMPSISIAIDFVLDRENHLGVLVSLINSDSFWVAVSLAPGAALVARRVSDLAQKVIQAFIPARESVPILQFNGDFNLASEEGLKEGHYAILGSNDASHPLPSAYANLTVRNRRLLMNDLEVTDLSYVILDVFCAEVRTREMNGGALWDIKLREAEDEIQGLTRNPFATKKDYQQGWKKCQALLREAQALIRNDPNYLRSEAENIISGVYAHCEEAMKPEGRAVRHRGAVAVENDWTIETRADRELLGVPQEDSELNAILDCYAEQVVEARRKFKAVGLR